jgi:hypothetical protein
MIAGDGNGYAWAEPPTRGDYDSPPLLRRRQPLPRP